MAISVGSVQVDVIPNTRGIYSRLRDGLAPAATKAGEDAGKAAGRSFSPAMASEVGGVGQAIGRQIGQEIASRITAEVRDALRDGVTQGGRTARPAVTRQGEETGGAFARAARARIEAAFRSLPNINIGADTTPAQAELASLRAQLATLSDQRAGIDIDTAAAQARVTEIQGRLERLSASDADIAVRVDAGVAATQLAAVQAMVTRLDGQTAHVNVDTRGAMRALLQLSIALGSVAALPTIPAIAAGIGSIGSAAVAAGVGVGALAAVAVPAISDIKKALDAQKQAQDAVARGGEAAATAQAKYQAALAQLSPAARGTFDAFTQLRTAFKAWSASLQPAVMPIFTRGLKGIRKSLSGLTPLVLAAASGIKRLQDRVSAGFKSPWWQSFKKDIAGSVEPAIVGLGTSFGRVFKGMAGIIQSFLPHMDDISRTMQRITGRFADWGTSLKGSPEFERFMDYTSRMGPQAAEAVGKLANAFYQVARALAPLSGPALTVLGVLADGVAKVATTAPWLVQGIYALIIATRLWTIGQAALNLVLRANPIGLIITAIALLVAAVIYAYKHWGWFRTAVQAAWKGIQAAASFAWRNVIKPVFDAIVASVKWVGRFFTWLWKTIIKPAWIGIQLAIGTVWKKNIRPVFDALCSAVGKVGDAFNVAVRAIKKAWDKVSGIAKKPVAFIVNTIYNGGIVGVWNKVAKAFGAPQLHEFHPKGFARGGVIPGYQSRKRDDVMTPMRSGEGVLVPEVVRGLGAGTIHALNAAGNRGGAGAVRNMVGYAKGGIVGQSWDWIKHASSVSWDAIRAGQSWLKDGMKASALAGMNKLVKPLISKIAGSASLYKDMVTRVPKRMLTAVYDYSGEADKKLAASGRGGPGVQAALRWARAQAGKPYIWGGVGPRGYDCSGFMGAIQNRILGRTPYRRVWATGAFSGSHAPAGWVRGLASPFQVGITNRGVGHTAGTLGGVHVESRGGDGVVIGPSARGANSSLFGAVYGYRPALKYDSGGMLQPGLNLAYNGTGRPEPVLTTQQLNALTGAAVHGADGASIGDMSVHVFVGNREITDIARAEVRAENGRVLTALNARPRR